MIRGLPAAAVGAIVLLFLVTACRSSKSPTVHVDHSHSFEDEPLALAVSKLAPHQDVSIGLRSTDANGLVWVASGRYRADAGGVVATATTPSRGGSYRGVWAAGLVASLHPTRNDPAGGYVWFDTGPSRFDVTVRSHGSVVATGSFERSWSSKQLVRRELTVRTAGFLGDYFAPSAGDPSTAVLVFGGSEGGLSTSLLASRLAADGFPSLALAYFRAPGLPGSLVDVPLEYFRRALTWLAGRAQVAPRRIVVLGSSRGSEAALLLGVHYPSLVHGVVALVPSSVVNCGIAGAGQGGGCLGAAWTFRGKAVPYTYEFDNRSPTDVPTAVIPVERIHGRILLACGGRDATWSSCGYSRAILARLRRNGSRDSGRLYAYPAAGHAVGSALPYEPGSLQFDQNVPADEQAREALWPHLVSFLRALR